MILIDRTDIELLKPWKYPSQTFFNRKLYLMLNFEVSQHCIATCLKCAAICNHCATSCLADEDVAKLTRVIQLNRECSYICNVTAQVLSLRGESIQALCELCESICKACSEEASKHDKEFCRLSDDICRRTIIECRNVTLKFANRTERLKTAI